MFKLNGIVPPASAGEVLEVHVDLAAFNPNIQNILEGFGFETDPFVEFWPAGYVAHYTGRTKVGPKQLQLQKMLVEALAREIAAVGVAENCPMYVEVELVRSASRFAETGIHFEPTLDQFDFSGTGRMGGAAADIHVEFLAGSVSKEVREYLLAKNFYWVSTPAGAHYPAEDIATLQTQTFVSAQRVFTALIETPFPGCTAVHLEQKLGMYPSHPELCMPEVIQVAALVRA